MVTVSQSSLLKSERVRKQSMGETWICAAFHETDWEVMGRGECNKNCPATAQVGCEQKFL